MVRKKRLRWFHYLLALIFGGGSGVGGWLFKEHSFAQRLFTQATGVNPEDASNLGQDEFRKVMGSLPSRSVYTRAGAFEVKFAHLKLEPTSFKAGQTVDLQVKLIKREAEGRDSTIWESQVHGERIVNVGKEELQTGWGDQPIAVAWKPGDRFVVEVWDHRWAVRKKWFEWTSGTEAAFPLQSGTYVLSPAQVGSSAINSTQNRFVLETRPLGDRDKTSEVAGASGGYGSDDSETIRIK